MLRQILISCETPAPRLTHIANRGQLIEVLALTQHAVRQVSTLAQLTRKGWKSIYPALRPQCTIEHCGFARVPVTRMGKFILPFLIFAPLNQLANMSVKNPCFVITVAMPR